MLLTYMNRRYIIIPIAVGGFPSITAANPPPISVVKNSIALLTHQRSAGTCHLVLVTVTHQEI